MEESLQTLLSGNDRHCERVAETLADLQDAQRPDVVSVSCGDSRVLQDDMWDNSDPGELFTHSNIGNRVTQNYDGGRVVAGDVLFPLVHTGTDTAIVVGHTGCGAVTATYQWLTDGIEEPPGITHCLEMLAADLEPGVEKLPADIDDDAAVNRLVEYNVDQQVAFLVDSEDVPASVNVVGVVYDFHGVYSDTPGAIQIVNVDGVRDPATLRETYPTLADRISRNWTY